MNDIAGRAFCFGDHINTDVIHPPQFFSLNPERVKQGLFHNYDPTLQPSLLPNDIIVAGKNFGCGSSRETSIRSLKLNRIGAIVAVDFARIFFRSATNNGIPCLVLERPADGAKIAQGQRVRISFQESALVLESGEALKLSPVPEFIRNIWRAGGLLETLSQ
jgi:3-isopropylmalate dehydratase small subunit